MSWTDLLFVHWRVDPERVRQLLPDSVELDTFDGSAWVALVPFRMTGCRFRGFGWVPTLANFYECNVRTYARVNGLAGVWFFSLDAANLLPVVGGRRVWNLNYVHARFRVTHQGERHDYALERRRGPWAPGRTRAVWRTGETLSTSTPGSLEHFLTERYWLFTTKRDRVFGGRIHHTPWSLRRATIERLDDTLMDAAGLEGLSAPDSVLASTRIDVTGDPLRAIAR